jgi:hypothetical protein
MFEQYAMSVAAGLVILMLVALVVLAVVLASIDPRGPVYVYDVVGLMGTTSVITACVVSLCILFLVYGPTGKDCKRDMPAAGLTAEHTSVGEEPRATIIEAYPHEPSDLSTYLLVHATPDDERD